MTKITPPKVPVPIGRVTIGGQSFDVMQHPEFVRFFFDLFKRVGGTDAMGNAELYALLVALDDAAGRLDAMGAHIGALRNAIEALQGGEMVMQRAQQDALMPDVMQAAQADSLAHETTFYG